MSRKFLICICCGATYEIPTNYWCELLMPNLETKGLCEFCDPNNKKWYVEEKRCHLNKLKE